MSLSKKKHFSELLSSTTDHFLVASRRYYYYYYYCRCCCYCYAGSQTLMWHFVAEGLGRWWTVNRGMARSVSS